MIYILCIKVSKNFQTEIGRLGKTRFAKGYYFYIGSAQDRLETRLKRHLSHEKTPFWHIDYFLLQKETKITHIFVTSKMTECRVVGHIQRNLDARPINGFGASDCQCLGHLLYFLEKGNNLKSHLNKLGFHEFFLDAMSKVGSRRLQPARD